MCVGVFLRTVVGRDVFAFQMLKKTPYFTVCCGCFGRESIGIKRKLNGSRSKGISIRGIQKYK